MSAYSHEQNGPAHHNVVLQIRDMIKVREKGGARFELRVPTLTVHAGEFVAVVGASGCGKSTLLDMLGLVLKPDGATCFSIALTVQRQGRTLMDLRNKSERVLAQLRRQNIGYVLQSGGLLPYLTVTDNILLPCLLNKRPSQVSLPQVHILAKQLGIADHLEKKPAHLSGGQRQRVAIARSLIHNPNIVLADEPTAAVDRFTAVEIRDAFRAVASKQGVALLMVTHDYSLIKGCADRIVSFEVDKRGEGRIVSTLVEAVYG